MTTTMIRERLEGMRNAMDLPPTLALQTIKSGLDDLLSAVTTCDTQECSYYRHYLVHWTEDKGPKLEHAAFHHAEMQCGAAQGRCIDWMNDPRNGDKAIPNHLERRAEYWERKVLA